jgi:hypothetical protein
MAFEDTDHAGDRLKVTQAADILACALAGDLPYLHSDRGIHCAQHEHAAGRAGGTCNSAYRRGGVEGPCAPGALVHGGRPELRRQFLHGPLANTHWIESWHTAYVIGSFDAYALGTGDQSFTPVCARAGSSLARGTPKYYSDRFFRSISSARRKRWRLFAVFAPRIRPRST